MFKQTNYQRYAMEGSKYFIANLKIRKLTLIYISVTLSCTNFKSVFFLDMTENSMIFNEMTARYDFSAKTPANLIGSRA